LALLLCLALSVTVAQLGEGVESLEAHDDLPFASEGELEHVAEERDLIAALGEKPEEAFEEHQEERDMHGDAEDAEQLEEQEGERDMQGDAEAEEPTADQLEEQDGEQRDMLQADYGGDAEEGLEREHPFSGEDEDDGSSLLQTIEAARQTHMAAADPRITKAQRVLQKAQEKKRSLLTKIKSLKVQLEKQKREWKRAFHRARYLKGQADAAENIKKNLAFRVTQMVNRVDIRKRRRLGAEAQLNDSQKKLQKAYQNLVEAERQVVRKSHQVAKAKRELERTIASRRADKST